MHGILSRLHNLYGIKMRQEPLKIDQLTLTIINLFENAKKMFLVTFFE